MNGGFDRLAFPQLFEHFLVKICGQCGNLFKPVRDLGMHEINVSVHLHFVVDQLVTIAYLKE